MTREIEVPHTPAGENDHETSYIAVSEGAFAFYEAVKNGERIEAKNPGPFIDELMTLGLIETQALVWETRVCYVLTGADPRRDAVVDILREWTDPDSALDFADRILAVLK